MKNSHGEEIWKDIDGYEGLYQVSSLGRVKALQRYRRAGNTAYTQKEHFMTQYDNTSGYKYVRLNIGSDKRMFFVHRLVANAFIANPMSLPEVNHKNEIKTDNNVDNLEWCTYSYNNTYNNVRERISKKQRNNEKNSICVSQFSEDGKFLQAFPSISEASRCTGISVKGIRCSCKSNKNCFSDRPTRYGFRWRYE